LPRFTGSEIHYGIEQTGEGTSRGPCAGVRALPARPGASRQPCPVPAWNAQNDVVSAGPGWPRSRA